jgi:GNAT superfamily N-acetyltransferase
MNINVQNEDAIYLGYIYEDELSAIGNIYIENNEMWIGDFEVSKFKTHKGIGRLFFNAILEEFSNYSTITLTYLDTAARLFWEKMGFIGNDKNKIMTLDMNKKQIYESIMAKVAV